MLQTIINSPELSSGIIILSSYVLITLTITALCTITVNRAVKHLNKSKYYNKPITAQTITTQVRGNKQINNTRQRKVA